MFSTRIFSKFEFGNRICKAMELESLRCNISGLERVVLERPTYTLVSLETQTPKGHLNDACPIKKFSGEGSVIRNN